METREAVFLQRESNALDLQLLLSLQSQQATNHYSDPQVELDKEPVVFLVSYLLLGRCVKSTLTGAPQGEGAVLTHACLLAPQACSMPPQDTFEMDLPPVSPGWGIRRTEPQKPVPHRFHCTSLFRVAACLVFTCVVFSCKASVFHHYFLSLQFPI